MSVTGVSYEGPVVAVRAGRSTAWWGMVMLMITEGMLFLLLIFVYFFFMAQDGSWPPEGLEPPSLSASWPRAALLLLSSVPMVLAERALTHRGDAVRCALMLTVTLLMAGVFMYGHVAEQAILVEELSPTETAYGSVFLTVINFHALHLLIGMAILVFVLAQVLRGRATAARPTQLTTGGLYWHFVDAVWVVVYGALYISPHVLGR